uniref:Uncharacterized protein n=1 Tax=Branchiostoma floridae TaxID=7739 RepID=C3ZUV7_BRAFL|eukprot:XP_002587691.1 hypothetical protein BRAFLDRAFT_92741 [Branchiostoma floridae]
MYHKHHVYDQAEPVNPGRAIHAVMVEGEQRTTGSQYEVAEPVKAAPAGSQCWTAGAREWVFPRPTGGRVRRSYDGCASAAGESVRLGPVGHGDNNRVQRSAPQPPGQF